jgi:hypothetical protein
MKKLVDPVMAAYAKENRCGQDLRGDLRDQVTFLLTPIPMRGRSFPAAISLQRPPMTDATVTKPPGLWRR